MSAQEMTEPGPSEVRAPTLTFHPAVCLSPALPLECCVGTCLVQYRKGGGPLQRPPALPQAPQHAEAHRPLLSVDRSSGAEGRHFLIPV